ncbi:MAG: hypothetical protein V3575_04200 [Candidatus Absconditabacteria bacterium]
MNSFVRIFVALCLSYSGYILLTKLFKFTPTHSFALIALFLLCIVCVTSLYKSHNKSKEKEAFRRCTAKVERRLRASKPFNSRLERHIHEVEETMEDGEAKQEYLALLYLLKEEYIKSMVNLPQGEKASDLRLIALELVPAVYENYNLLSHSSKLSMQNSFIRHINRIKDRVKSLSQTEQECD